MHKQLCVMYVNVYVHLVCPVLVLISGEDRKPKFVLMNMLQCLKEAMCVCMCVLDGVWRKEGGGGSYFRTVLAEMRQNPKRMQIGLSTHAHKQTHAL